MIEQFKLDVEEGLSSLQKRLPSRYFYDKVGDELFVKIMNMPEYYLTDAELEIIREQAGSIVKSLGVEKQKYFELIELGAGDGTKTKELLRLLVVEGYNFDYFPVDISQNALDGLERKLYTELPSLNVKSQHGDYFEILSSLKTNSRPKVLLFLGSNIGNLSDEVASEFIYKLGANLRPNDKLLLGVDLIKSKDIISPAYDDELGITRDFNLNLLERINRELQGNFNIAEFIHAPEYLESEGIAKSYIMSTMDQEVSIDAIGKSFNFKKGEKIHTEISRKYNDQIVNQIITNTDFRIIAKFMDNREYFADYILERG